MSTRSGKRIHNSFHEETVKPESDSPVRSERKTRNKRLKENVEQVDIVAMPKTKKRENYVTYPTDDELVGNVGEKNASKTRKNTLKEHNIIPNDEPESELKKTRVTRQTRKFAEEGVNGDHKMSEVPDTKRQKKSKKKKAKTVQSFTESDTETIQSEKVTRKSKKKKKKHSDTTSKEIKKDINKSNISTDSFHSAAGSPLLRKLEIPQDNFESTEKELNSTFDTTLVEKLNTVEKQMRNKRKSSNKHSTFDKIDIGTPGRPIRTSIQNSTEKNITITPGKLNKTNNNCTIDGKIKARKSSLKNTVVDKIENETSEILNSTFDKDTNTENIDQLNTTFEKSNTNTENTNTTFEKENSSTKKINKNVEKENFSTKNINTTFEKENGSIENINTTFEKEPTHSQLQSLVQENPELNTTFDKPTDSKTVSLNSTFDKETNNSTFDKNDSKSSNNIVNITLDKSDSRISITSDDSRTENIINTTPVLIESSLDESKHSELNKTKTPTKSVTPAKSSELLAVTPLKREGTFTKDITSPNARLSSEHIPTEILVLPSPGFTPFRVSRSSQKEKESLLNVTQNSQKEKKSLLNVTRSIEKPTRRSSLAEVVPRQTRVMFCSPVDNPVLMSQQKRKVIKSSMKGSNKSFVVEENEPVVRPATRKRSLTLGDADDSRAKRKRIAGAGPVYDRQRTTSASAKLSEPATPSKKAATPAKSKTETKRTKLPNFAALHQKQFDRMESLDECQERKARRARQLLTPKRASSTAGVGTTTTNGAGAGRVTTTKQQPKDKEIKQPAPTNLPTLESLRPGVNRFGFKMNTTITNPFSITKSKTNISLMEKPSEIEKPVRKTFGNEKISLNGYKPNGVDRKTGVNVKINALNGDKPDRLQRKTGIPSKSNNIPKLQEKNNILNPQPSLIGATVSRKSAAKQTVMREKSFSLSSKRDATRSENRTLIKGVRTNRRFELQMKMRNLE